MDGNLGNEPLHFLGISVDYISNMSQSIIWMLNN